MKKLLISSLMAAGTLLAAHLIDKRQTPWAFAQDVAEKVTVKKAQFDTFNKAKAAFQDRLATFQQTLDQAQPTINAINQDAAKFQFKLEHRLAQIQKTTDHMNAELERLDRKA